MAVATAPRLHRTRLRTSPRGSSAQLNQFDCRAELLRQDIIALTDELTDELANPTVFPLGSDRATVHTLLTRIRFVGGW